MDHVGRVSVKVGIARVDPAEVGKEGNQPSARLIDAVAGPVNFGDFLPGQDRISHDGFSREIRE